jgi:radical SAM protein with 4Fe4S-binding SPASM domain
MSRVKRFQKVYIEISNVCNLQCGFCPEVEREKDVMGRELFGRVIRDVAPLAEQACFHLMGEPLTHPLFAEFVALCAAESLPVNLTTNGTLLSEGRVEALLNPIVRQVNFSVHSFQANFPGRDIGAYLEKIFDFTRLAFARRPDLYVNYRLWNLDGADEDKNADVIARVEQAFGVSLDKRVDIRRSKGRTVLNRLSLHFDTRFDWPSLNAPFQSMSGTCRALSSHIGILSDGTVVPCCLDKEGVTNLGNVRRQTLSEVLAGEKAAAMTDGFKKGRLTEDLCHHCTFISRFDRKAARLAGASR